MVEERNLKGLQLKTTFRQNSPTRVFKASCVLVLLPHCVAAPLALAMGALGCTCTLVICSTDMTPEPRF